MFDNINEIRNQFPALKQEVNAKPLVYLDNGATAQKPLGVLSTLKEMNGGLNGNIHRAVHYLSSVCTERYENARRTVQRYIGASSHKEIIFTSGATAALNMAAFCIGEAFVHSGHTIAVTVAEHHSNIVPWQMLCQRKGAKLRVIEIDKSGHINIDSFRQAVEGATVVSFAHVSNVLGLINPVRELANIAHASGAIVVVDGAQGIVHCKVDVEQMDADFYAFSAHKIYGPTGVGVLYGKEKYLQQMPPWQGGGDMIANVSLSKGTTYAPPPLKFEAGTSNFIGAAALGSAIEFMENIDANFEKTHSQAIVDKVTSELLSIEGLELYGRENYKGEKVPLFTFNINGVHPSDLAMLLNGHAIAVRSGQLCAEPLLEFFGKTTALRASFAVYNTLEEADFFIDKLHWAVKMLK